MDANASANNMMEEATDNMMMVDAVNHIVFAYSHVADLSELLHIQQSFKHAPLPILNPAAISMSIQ